MMDVTRRNVCPQSALADSSGSIRKTYRDNFDVASFSNNNGDTAFAGPWVENDGVAVGPSAGNVKIAGGVLTINNHPSVVTPSWGVTRKIDLPHLRGGLPFVTIPRIVSMRFAHRGLPAAPSRAPLDVHGILAPAA